eukprot:scaffold92846_cov27-Tisochrysis_lutea.AAC.1
MIKAQLRKGTTQRPRDSTAADWVAAGTPASPRTASDAAGASASEARLRREDMAATAGRSLSELALGNAAEWKAAVHKARSDAVTAVRVRHIVVQSAELAQTLRTQLKEGARFDELAQALSTCAVTREKGGEIGWSGVNDEHLDEYFPRELRELAMGVKPGDMELAESSCGWHLLQVVDVFQTLMIESNPRTRALPGTGVKPQPLINLLRSSRADARDFKQLVAAGATSAGEGAGELMRNSGKTAQAATMKYSMDSMGCGGASGGGAARVLHAGRGGARRAAASPKSGSR